MLPDRSTNRRGGTRLMRVTSKGQDRLHVDLELLDAGLNVAAIAPTIGTLGQEAGNTRHGITVPVTLNGSGQPVRIEYAVTATSVGSAPAASDPLWTFAQRATATGTETIRQLPSGSRVWVRIRTEPSRDTQLQLPSAWVLAATAYVDTAAIAAPSGLAISGITGTSALATFTPADTTLPVDILLVTPSSGTPELVFTLREGATRHVLQGLTPSSSYKIHVRQPDGVGGFSAVAETTFSTTSSVPTAPGAPAVAVLVGITS
jgi:hypothetical protein